MPDWVKTDEALHLLSWSQRDAINAAHLTFASEYDAEALGSPDPNWQGQSPRAIQDVIDEQFRLASLALWIVTPSRISCGPSLHFGRNGDSASLRRASELPRILVAEEEDAIPTPEDFIVARRLFEAILVLPREGTIWTAVRVLIRAVTEPMWETRYLLQWVVLESLFGSTNTQETTYRLSQRLALFLGDQPDECKDLFEKAKSGYAWRSKIVHGMRLSSLTTQKAADLAHISERLLRRTLRRVLDNPAVRSKFDSQGREEYLDSLLFDRIGDTAI